jgi:hypothetical protein
MNLSDETAKQGKIPEAIAEVVKFAKYPNVQVKMSSVPHKSSQGYPFRDLTPHLNRVFDALGPRRCFWGTDLTAGIDRFPKFTYQQRPLHRGTAVPDRAGQGLGDGSCGHAAAGLDVNALWGK